MRGTRNSYRILLGRPLEMLQLGRPRRRWKVHSVGGWNWVRIVSSGWYTLLLAVLSLQPLLPMLVTCGTGGNKNNIRRKDWMTEHKQLIFLKKTTSGSFSTANMYTEYVVFTVCVWYSFVFSMRLRHLSSFIYFTEMLPHNYN